MNLHTRLRELVLEASGFHGNRTFFFGVRSELTNLIWKGLRPCARAPLRPCARAPVHWLGLQKSILVTLPPSGAAMLSGAKGGTSAPGSGVL